MNMEMNEIIIDSSNEYPEQLKGGVIARAMVESIDKMAIKWLLKLEKA